MNPIQQLGFFRRCENCKRLRVYVSKRKIELPTKDIATSQKVLCKSCFSLIQRALNKPIPQNEES